MLLGVFAMAQTNIAQDPRAPGRISPAISPIAPGQNSSAVRSANSGGPLSAGTDVNFSAPVAPSANVTTNLNPTQSSEMLIGPGDLLEVSVYGAPDYDKQVRVSATGEITLPLAGTMKVGGKTTTVAEAIIAKKLSDGKYFNDPTVSVLTKEFATQGISVLGEVQKPGIYPLPGTRNLLDALSAAGGTTSRAGNLVSVTHRNDPQKRQVVNLSYDGKAEQPNIPVYPGDTVVVSKAGVVYVTGDVHLPGGFIMENAHMTVLQAVAMAQGVNPTAALDKARLIRNTGNGTQPQEVPIALRKIMSAKAPDVNLQPNDIVFIPNSAAKSAGRKTLSAIVDTAAGMAIYGRF